MSLRIHLDRPCTQEEFAELVGITQPTVSKLVTRGILIPGQTAQHWLDRYLSHLRSVIIDRLQGRL
jgi:transcriptional regulator with XRE-family HTH domain